MGMCDLYIGVTGSLNEIPKCHKDKSKSLLQPHFLSTAVSDLLVLGKAPVRQVGVVQD